MPTRKGSSAPSTQILLDELLYHRRLFEDIRSQNRLIVEAIEAMRSALEQRIERMTQGSRDWRSALTEARDLGRG